MIGILSRRDAETRALILHYHRVTDRVRDTNRLCVSPQRFSMHMDMLRRFAAPIPLAGVLLPQEVAQRRRVVAVTIDDGYADNLYEGKPVLERYEVPATIFVVTGNLGSRSGFWWDELERLVWSPQALPRVLTLNIQGKSRRFKFAPLFRVRLPGPRWDERTRLYRSLRTALLPLDHISRSAMLAQLREQIDLPTASASDCVLTPDEIRKLVSGSLVEVGAHTVTHPVLSALPLCEQQAEICNSKIALESIIGRPVHGLAYPYGGPATYSKETVAAVRNAGFSFACTTSSGKVQSNSDPFRLPRVNVGNWSAEEFSTRMRKLTQ